MTKTHNKTSWSSHYLLDFGLDATQEVGLRSESLHTEKYFVYNDVLKKVDSDRYTNIKVRFIQVGASVWGCVKQQFFQS